MNNNNNEIRNQARRQRIQRLSQNIKELTETLNQLIIEDNTSRETPIRVQQHPRIQQDNTSRETPIRVQQHPRTHRDSTTARSRETPANRVHRPHQASSEEFEIEDRVEILNNYLGLKGARGVVTQVTAKQVCVRVDGGRRVYTKFKKSVRKLRDNESS
jgi:hypothetical protein